MCRPLGLSQEAPLSAADLLPANLSVNGGCGVAVQSLLSMLCTEFAKQLRGDAVSCTGSKRCALQAARRQVHAGLAPLATAKPSSPWDYVGLYRCFCAHRPGQFCDAVDNADAASLRSRRRHSLGRAVRRWLRSEAGACTCCNLTSLLMVVQACASQPRNSVVTSRGLLLPSLSGGGRSRAPSTRSGRGGYTFSPHIRVLCVTRRSASTDNRRH